MNGAIGAFVLVALAVSVIFSSLFGKTKPSLEKRLEKLKKDGFLLEAYKINSQGMADPDLGPQGTWVEVQNVDGYGINALRLRHRSTIVKLGELDYNNHYKVSNDSFVELI